MPPSDIDNLRSDMMREFAEVKAKQDHTNGDVLELKLWRAEMKGSLRTLTWFCSLPTIVAAVVGVIMVLR